MSNMGDKMHQTADQVKGKGQEMLHNMGGDQHTGMGHSGTGTHMGTHQGMGTGTGTGMGSGLGSGMGSGTTGTDFGTGSTGTHGGMGSGTTGMGSGTTGMGSGTTGMGSGTTGMGSDTTGTGTHMGQQHEGQHQGGKGVGEKMQETWENVKDTMAKPFQKDSHKE